MKFPLPQRPFDHVRLPSERLEQLEQLAADVLDANLDDYHHFVHTQQRVLSKNDWKLVKKRDNVHVFKQRTPKRERVFSALGSAPPSSTNLLPKLLAVGTVEGTMADMMLGTALRDAASLLVKSSYVGDEFVDCDVLHELRGRATEDDPFRCVALKWILKAHPSGLNAVVAPRDMVVIQSSGLIQSGRIGYHVVHSVDLDEYPPLDGGSKQPSVPILRARLSNAFFFQQAAPQVVEVYLATYVDPNGSAPEAVAIHSSARSMCGAWKAVGCAHNMKLAWILQNKDEYMDGSGIIGGEGGEGRERGEGCCALCARHKATLVACALCGSWVCSRCHVTKKLSHVDRQLQLSTSKHDVCKSCFVRVVQEDALRIAKEKYAGLAIVPWADPVRRGPHDFVDNSTRASSDGDTRRFGEWRETMSTLSSSLWSDRGVPKKAAGYESEEEQQDQVRGAESATAQQQEDDETWRGSSLWSRASSLWKDHRKSSLSSHGSYGSYGSDRAQAHAVDGQDQDPYWHLHTQMQSLQLAANKTLRDDRDRDHDHDHDHQAKPCPTQY